MNRKDLLILVPLALFALNASVFYPFLSDDALISLRYSSRFVSGEGLTWNDGERVEGYSNLLWVLLSSGLMSVGVPGVPSLRILGLLCSLLFLITASLYWRRKPLCVFAPLLFASLSAPLAVWAVGGLEQPLVMLLVCLSVPLLWRAKAHDSVSGWLLASVPLAFLCLTRPDGALFTAAAFLAAVLFRCGKRSLWLLLLPVLFFAAQTVFRLHYYGDWVPNTARIKVKPSLITVLRGGKYVLSGVLSLFPLTALSIAGFLRGVRLRSFRLVLPGIMAVSWLLYVTVIGGDIFPAWRHLLPVIPLFVFLSTEFLSGIPGRKYCPVVVASALLLFIPLQYALPLNRAAVEERWEWDARVVSLALVEAFGGEPPLIAVTAAGSIPYWTGFPAVDMLGLNDEYLALNPGEATGGCIAWHSVCNPEYILSRSPDIVSFNAAGDTTGLPVARELVADPVFTGNYTRMIFRGDVPYTSHGLLWFNRQSPLTGISFSEDTLRIPSWFLNRYKHTVCFVQESSPGVMVEPDRPAGGTFPELSGNDWTCVSPRGLCVTVDPDCYLEVTAEDSVFVTGLVLVSVD